MNLKPALFTIGMALISIFVYSLFPSCATTPETKRKQLMLVPEKQMHQLGAQTYNQMRSELKTVNNPALTKAIQDISGKLINAAGHSFEWEVSVFESEQLNAFCLPGGKIGVYKGILKVAPTNAHIAAIIGHEIAHATARHGAERMSQGLLAQGALSLANISLNNSKYRQIILGAMGVGLQFGVMLPYSRSHESEADHIGTLYMAEAGFDPQAAVEVWKNMAQISKGDNPPEFMSTHPQHKTRIQQLNKNMPEYLNERHKATQKIETKSLPSL